jgi:anthranilate synthase component 1
MTTPRDLTAFRAVARAGIAVPVVRELVHGAHEPLAMFATLAAGSRHAALLETSEAADADADMSIVAPDARGVLAGDDALDQAQVACADEVADIGLDLPRFVGGAIGMLGHEHVRTIEPTVPRSAIPHPAGAPDIAFLLVDTCIVVDHRAARTRAIHTVRIPDDADDARLEQLHAAAVATLDQLERRLGEAVPGAADVPLGVTVPDGAFAGVELNVADAEFEQLVAQAREHVLDGECVQVGLARRFDRPLEADPLLAYRALRAVSPAPYHALLRLDDVHVVGASPEQLVGVIDGRVTTHPIAGTRPRGVDAADDRRLEQELLADHKERCEHMMLVDLGRNDVGRVARPGSVRVERLCEVERFSHVMHLVSRVSGELREGLHPVDALRAAFPAGTLTGAPRVRAMQLIAELERDQRGPYGGVIGYVGHGRVLDMAITIRSAILAGGRAYVQAGAGVVADSDPASEAAETRHKARAVLVALALAERTHQAAATASTPAEVVA